MTAMRQSVLTNLAKNILHENASNPLNQSIIEGIFDSVSDLLSFTETDRLLFPYSRKKCSWHQKYPNSQATKDSNQTICQHIV